MERPSWFVISMVIIAIAAIAIFTVGLSQQFSNRTAFRARLESQGITVYTVNAMPDDYIRVVLNPEAFVNEALKSHVAYQFDAWFYTLSTTEPNVLYEAII